MSKDTQNLDWSQLRGLLADSGARTDDLDRFDVVMSRRRFFGLVGKGGALAALAGFGAGTEAVLTGLLGRGMIPVS